MRAMKVTYLSHSAFLVETGSHRVLIDPFLTGNPLAAVKPEELSCDAIILSHGHEDHVGDAIPIARRCNADLVAGFELAMFCAARGVKKVHPMNPGGSRTHPFGRVTLTPAIHSAGYPANDGFAYLGQPCGILLTAGDRTLFHAGDTALFSDLKLIGEAARIDAALLPIGDNFTMGIDDAARAAEWLNCGLAIPMHYNTFDLIKADPQEFARKVEGRGRRAKVMAAGETIEI